MSLFLSSFQSEIWFWAQTHPTFSDDVTLLLFFFFEVFPYVFHMLVLMIGEQTEEICLTLSEPLKIAISNSLISFAQVSNDMWFGLMLAAS